MWRIYRWIYTADVGEPISVQCIMGDSPSAILKTICKWLIKTLWYQSLLSKHWTFKWVDLTKHSCVMNCVRLTDLLYGWVCNMFSETRHQTEPHSSAAWIRVSAALNKPNTAVALKDHRDMRIDGTLHELWQLIIAVNVTGYNAPYWIKTQSLKPCFIWYESNTSLGIKSNLVRMEREIKYKSLGSLISM